MLKKEDKWKKELLFNWFTYRQSFLEINTEHPSVQALKKKDRK